MSTYQLGISTERNERAVDVGNVSDPLIGTQLCLPCSGQMMYLIRKCCHASCLCTGNLNLLWNDGLRNGNNLRRCSFK